MSIKTIVNWGTAQNNPNSDEQTALGVLKMLISTGTTDGVATVENTTITRVWTTLEAAQQWVDFLKGLDIPPASTDIVQD